ncbi:TetR/AcrR family transcriptional regulator [Rhizobium sp. LEGMi198b]|uniref:TetR/AcrR family transcriptional regulator n=1 Tax=unclassified Rhizobium TaxID=2613769 RepID=UPI000CDF3583|nr:MULTISPECIES: TetR/AcrR family transcriptional regulator [Rhizobium]AVA23441.1 TetR family transcriptional regulator protein [Rhizobium sp. NXC24]MDK4739565.1 TetR/AcrR family transcriptional regulator [Rhizobium sp. CNPSo 3464]UWU20788.1 TetR/AcrR family transcriptional regulator [Rhizobium tropici]WFU01598.1 TetR/AcrR family transcriptional regulator [Rhizobium sp. CB3171]
MSNISTKADEIVQSARGLIIAGGYNSFSFADISAEVGIRKASIHHHFPTKADLVRTVVARYREEARQGLAGVDANIADPVARLRAYTGFWEACIRDNTAPFCICAMLAAELPVLPADVAAEVRGHFRDLSSWLAAVMEKGAAEGRLILPRPAAGEALSFMATVHGAMLSARAYGDPSVFATIVEPLFDRLATLH